MKVRLMTGFVLGTMTGWWLHGERERLNAALRTAAARSRTAAAALLYGEGLDASPAAHEPAQQSDPTVTAIPIPDPGPATETLEPVAPVPVSETPMRKHGNRGLAVLFSALAIVFALMAVGGASWEHWRHGGSVHAQAEDRDVQALVAHRTSQLAFEQSPTLSVFVGNGDRAAIVGLIAPAPTGKTYEAWVVRGGEPHAAALFDGESGRAAIALSRLVPPGATVAVTIERARGVAEPTSTPLFHVTRSLPAAVLAILAQHNKLRLPLAGSDGHLTVLVGRDDRAVLISSGFPTAPAHKQYEAWIVRGNNVSAAGLFDGGRGRDVIALTHRVPRNATVAITLERAGGVSAPTHEPRYTATRN